MSERQKSIISDGVKLVTHLTWHHPMWQNIKADYNTYSNVVLIRRTPWILERNASFSSPIHGRGLFTKSQIDACTVVMRFGGQLFSLEDARSGKARNDSATGYAEGLYVAVSKSSEPTPDELLNHSCDPNLWLVDPLTLVARRTIHRGEELTADYATWEIDNEWRLPTECKCKSPLCRVHITGRDWENSVLQERYAGHFLPCLEERIWRHHSIRITEEKGAGVVQRAKGVENEFPRAVVLSFEQHRRSHSKGKRAQANQRRTVFL